MATIRDVMNSEVVTVEPTVTVAEAATVMGERRIGCLLVLRGDDLAGIFTERDIVKALANHFDAAGHQVENWMTPNPVSIGSDAPVQRGLDAMLQGNFRHLPVVDDGRLVGVVSIRDLSSPSAD